MKSTDYIKAEYFIPFNMTCDPLISSCDEPDFVRFSVNENDVRLWVSQAQAVADLDAYSMESFDYRCEFYRKNEATGGVDICEDFRAEIVQRVVTSKGVHFSGVVKHSDHETWESTVVTFDTLKADLGIEDTLDTTDDKSQLDKEVVK